MPTRGTFDPDDELLYSESEAQAVCAEANTKRWRGRADWTVIRLSDAIAEMCDERASNAQVTG